MQIDLGACSLDSLAFTVLVHSFLRRAWRSPTHTQEAKSLYIGQKSAKRNNSLPDTKVECNWGQTFWTNKKKEEHEDVSHQKKEKTNVVFQYDQNVRHTCVNSRTSRRKIPAKNVHTQKSLQVRTFCKIFRPISSRIALTKNKYARHVQTNGEKYVQHKKMSLTFGRFARIALGCNVVGTCWASSAANDGFNVKWTYLERNQTEICISSWNFVTTNDWLDGIYCWQNVTSIRFGNLVTR